MAADDFQILPTWVYVEPPAYANEITKSESQKKEYQNLATDPIEIFILEFRGLSDAQAKTIYDHYKGRYGGYDSFAWKNAYIPSYIIALLGLASNDLTGRWVDESLKMTPRARSWDIEISFERQVS